MQIYLQGRFMDFCVKYLIMNIFFFVAVPTLLYLMDHLAMQICAIVPEVQEWNHAPLIHLQAHSTFEFTPMKVIQAEIWK